MRQKAYNAQKFSSRSRYHIEFFHNFDTTIRRAIWWFLLREFINCFVYLFAFFWSWRGQRRVWQRHPAVSNSIYLNGEGRGTRTISRPSRTRRNVHCCNGRTTTVPFQEHVVVSNTDHRHGIHRTAKHQRRRCHVDGARRTDRLLSGDSGTSALRPDRNSAATGRAPGPFLPPTPGGTMLRHHRRTGLKARITLPFCLLVFLLLTFTFITFLLLKGVSVSFSFLYYFFT